MAIDKKNNEGKVTTYDLSEQEREDIKLLLMTIGMVETIHDALQISLQVKQSGIERRVNITPAPEGFRNQTMLDVVKNQLVVRQIHVEKPRENKK